ncbi:MAG TPA: ROK family protein [Pyrinomonadaceae bacterium]|jgi:predicted NBD/HSP70 family sugar kinase
MKINLIIPHVAANDSEPASPARTTRLLLRLLRAAQPISRADLARRIKVNRSTVTDIFKPLINAGLVREEAFPMAAEGNFQGRPPIALSFADNADFFVGLNLGVRHSQVGLTTLSGEILAEEEFETPLESGNALKLARKKIERLCAQVSGRKLRTIGVSVPGPANAERRRLLYAPHLDWQDVDVAGALAFETEGGNVPVIVENDSAAAAMYEARLKLRNATDDLLSNFILVRSGTGIGVGLVLNNEVYRGAGRAQGLAGEFGHMTIMAGGKPCVCGNRGCWEKYASAGAATALYSGDRQILGGREAPRFIEIVERAESGEIRAQRSLERLGEYLGIGIANVIMGIGVQHVIVSGRLVYGWKYIEAALNEAVAKSMVGRLPGWTVECGEPKGSALGGALEVAVDEFLMKGFIV